MNHRPNAIRVPSGDQVAHSSSMTESGGFGKRLTCVSPLPSALITYARPKFGSLGLWSENTILVPSGDHCGLATSESGTEEDPEVITGIKSPPDTGRR